MLAVFAVVFSACGPNTNRYGTWRWDGSDWQQLGETGKAATFFAEKLFYSAALGGLINANGQRWDGTHWVRNEGGPTPPPVGDGNQETAMVLDEASGQLLFLDPNDKSIWSWETGTWLRVLQGSGWPEARYLRGAAYDPERYEVLIVTCCAHDEYQTSSWNGHSLIIRATDSRLPPLSNYQIVADGGGHMLAFGQQDAGTPSAACRSSKRLSTDRDTNIRRRGRAIAL